MTDATTQRARFSGYRIQVLVMLLAVSTLGFGYLTLGLYVPILVIEMEASLTAITVLFSVVGGASMFFSFFSGPLSRRFGFKPLIIAGVIALLLGYVFLYFATDVLMLYLAGGLIGIALSWAGIVMIGRVVTEWFVARRGLMLGLAFACASLGAFIGSPIVSHLIATTGWRSASLITLIIMAAMSIPSALFIVVRPSDIGQLPLGEGDEAGTPEVAGDLSRNVQGVSGGAKWAAWALLLFAFFAACITSSGVYPNVANALVSNGFDITFAGSVLAVVAICGVIGNVTVGIVGDRIGVRAALVYVYVLAALAFILLNSASTVPVAFAFAIVFGLAQPIAGPIVTMLTLRIFGAKDFPVMIGRNDASLNLFTIIAPVTIGVLYDTTGSYTVPLFAGVVVLLLAIAAGLAAITISDAHKRRNPVRRSDDIDPAVAVDA